MDNRFPGSIPLFAALAALLFPTVIASTGCTRAVHSPPVGIETVNPGDRVRLQERDGTFAEGRVAACDSESLQITFANDVEPTSVDMTRVTWLQRRDGVKQHQDDGAFFGALAGFGIGFAIAESERKFFDVQWNPTPIALGVGIGTAVGFIVGLNIHTTRWETVTTERYGIAVRPERGRAGVFWNF